MLFNSFSFIVFLPIVFVLYWKFFYKQVDKRNAFIIIVSYIFYGWWDWRFLILIFLSSTIDFIIGIQLGRNKSQKTKNYFLALSIIFNLGTLGVFKYFNFFSQSFSDLFQTFDISLNTTFLNIILPVGISFYTFQTLSYTIDVYRNKMKPTTNPLDFFAYVSFFPQLVAGPIERATKLLPQFQQRHDFSYDLSVAGLRLILWGFFKKIVIADNAAIYVDQIWNNYGNLTGVELFVGALLFSIQIYCDFSGYSDIAIGVSRLFGFELSENFKTPYFSRNIGEFWRRWHISLSSWFKDYLYIPLGGSRVSNLKKFRNIFIIFLVSGFWHGANWTFIIWGLLHAIFYLPSIILKKNRKYLETSQHETKYNFVETIAMIRTQLLVIVAWVFFRSESVYEAFSYLKLMFLKIFNFNTTINIDTSFLLMILIWIYIDWLIKDSNINQLIKGMKNKYIRKGFYYFLIFCILIFGSFENQNFIYFQF